MEDYIEKEAYDIINHLHLINPSKSSTFNPLLNANLDLPELGEIICKSDGDNPTARQIPGNCNRYSYPRHLHIFSGIIQALHRKFGVLMIPSGFYYYPKNAFCGWHTNSDNVGKRTYLIWTEEDNKSFFRHFDSKTGNLITKYDKKGWKINQFEAKDGEDCLWHCVGSQTNRISMGFRTVDESHFLFDKKILYLNGSSKSDYGFSNMLGGCHITTCKDGLNWRIMTNMDHRIPLKLFDDIYYGNQIIELDLDIVSWKCKDKPELKHDEYYDSLDTELPCLAVETFINPHVLPFRAIDGSHRLCKLKREGKKTAKFFIISEYIFLKNITDIYEYNI